MSFWQKQKGYRETKVGGRVAAQAVTCGRAACSWRIHVPGSGDVSIFTFDPDESGKTGPDNARYPLPAIIDSIKFAQAFPK